MSQRSEPTQSICLTGDHLESWTVGTAKASTRSAEAWSAWSLPPRAAVPGAPGHPGSDGAVGGGGHPHIEAALSSIKGS